MAGMGISLANADSYDPATNRLTVSSIQVGNTIYSNVVVIVGSVISVGSSTVISAPVTTPTLTTSCSAAKLRSGSSNITAGMTVDQVSQLLGCLNDKTPSDNSLWNTALLNGSGSLLWDNRGTVGTMTSVQVAFSNGKVMLNTLFGGPIVSLLN
jgi:hypothetical protein